MFLLLTALTMATPPLTCPVLPEVSCCTDCHSRLLLCESRSTSPEDKVACEEKKIKCHKKCDRKKGKS